MSKLLFDEYPLIVLPGLACAVGLNEAMILQQIHYWLQKSEHEHEGRRWIYNTYDGWQEQFPFWSIPTIRRALASLSKPYEPKSETDPRVKRGPLVLVGRFNRAGFDKTNWYTIDYKELGRLEGMIRRSDQNDQTIGSKRSDGSDQNDQTYTRDYTETTRELKDLWKKALSDLKGQMTKATYDQWLAGSMLLSAEDGRATVGVKNELAKDWLEHRLAPTVQRTLARLLGQEVELSFEVLE